MRIPKHINDHILFKHVAGEDYECVYLQSLPSLVVSNSDDPPGSFWPKDMFHKHPFKPNAWKCIGHLDDGVTLSNDKKMLPLPINGRLRQDPWTKEAIIYGTGSSVPGMLIFRNHHSRVFKFTDRVWPTIKAVNAHSEKFSQFSEETIIPMSADVDYPETDKNIIKRFLVYTKFSKEIEAMFHKIDLSCDRYNLIRHIGFGGLASPQVQ